MIDEDVPLKLSNRALPEGHRWRTMGYGSVEVLEYREDGDEHGYRTVTISRPAGTWTVGALAEAMEHIQSILQGRPPLPEE